MCGFKEWVIENASFLSLMSFNMFFINLLELDIMQGFYFTGSAISMYFCFRLFK